jgi:hypothetical protein
MSKITAQELRIGNWVLDYYGRPRQVAYVGEVVGLYNDIGGTDRYQKNPIISYDLERDLRAIPLSPEILEKAGFVKECPIAKMPEYFHHRFRFGNMVINSNPKWKNMEVKYGGLSLDDRTHICKITSLHQLQNLFWCLCGKELEIDLH